MISELSLSGDYSSTAEKRKWLPELPAMIISACILFNFVLCFLNTAGTPISVAVVVLCELTLVSLSASYGFFKVDRERCFWLSVLIAQLLLICLLSVLRNELLFKSFRDVMLMPVFIALGLASGKTDFSKPLLWLGGFIIAIALFEAFTIEVFTRFFDVKGYFIAKGYQASWFQYTSNNLFVSGVRPAGRFFPLPFATHRISSVFLEPVSLGFYAFISGLYFVAMKSRLPRRQILLAMLVTLSLIWLSDARMAFGSLMAVIMLRPLFARLDHRLSILVFPMALLAGLFIVESHIFNLSGEGLGARLLWTFQGIWQTKDAQFFGLKPYGIDMVDSGLLYLLGAQGVWGFLLYWLPPIFFKGRLSREARVYWYGASIFLTSGFLISGAIFTIKTAALLWFCYGYIIARTRETETPA